jgi:hypothetical protein
MYLVVNWQGWPHFNSRVSIPICSHEANGALSCIQRVGPSFSEQLAVTLSIWMHVGTRAGLSGRMREVGWDTRRTGLSTGVLTPVLACLAFLSFPPRLALGVLVFWRWGGAFWRWWRRSCGACTSGATVVPVSAGGGGGAGVLAPVGPCRWAVPVSLLSEAVLAGAAGGRRRRLPLPALCRGLFLSFSVCGLVDRILPIRCSIRGSCPQMHSL